MKKNVARHTSQKLGSPSARQPRQSLRGDQEVFSSSRACVTYATFKFTVQLCMTYASVFVRGRGVGHVDGSADPRGAVRPAWHPDPILQGRPRAGVSGGWTIQRAYDLPMYDQLPGCGVGGTCWMRSNEHGVRSRTVLRWLIKRWRTRG